MKHVAAYLLAQLGGKADPSAKDVTAILSSVGIEADSEKLDALLGNLKGRDIVEVIAAGRTKMAAMPSGGGGAAPAASAAAAPSGGGAAPAAKAKEPEPEPEEEEVRRTPRCARVAVCRADSGELRLPTRHTRPPYSCSARSRLRCARRPRASTSSIKRMWSRCCAVARLGRALEAERAPPRLRPRGCLTLGAFHECVPCGAAVRHGWVGGAQLGDRRLRRLLCAAHPCR